MEEKNSLNVSPNKMHSWDGGKREGKKRKKKDNETKEAK